MRRITKALGFIAVALVVNGACSNDNNDEPNPVEEGQHFTVATWLDGPQYLASTKSLSEGSLSFVGNGLEAVGSRYLHHGNYIYMMNLTEKKFNQYELTADGSISLKASILTDGVVPNYFQSLNVVDDNTLLVLGAVDNNEGKAGWARIEVPSFKVIAKGELQVPYDAGQPSLSFSVGRGYVDNGKFILGGYFYDSQTQAYAPTGVTALVYDYPSMANMEIIQSDVTKAGIGYDYLSSLDTDEEGNHYFVASAGKFWTGLGGKSGIVRIKKGEAKFDEDYFFDVTSQLDNGACLMGMTYVADGIAFGTVQYETMMTSVRDRLKNVGQVVKLDLENKEVTLMNTPLSPVAMVRSPLVYNGKYYTALCIDGGDANIYEFDPLGDADAFKKGLKLDAGGWTQVQLIAANPTP